MSAITVHIKTQLELAYSGIEIPEDTPILPSACTWHGEIRRSEKAAPIELSFGEVAGENGSVITKDDTKALVTITSDDIDAIGIGKYHIDVWMTYDGKPYSVEDEDLIIKG